MYDNNGTGGMVFNLPPAFGATNVAGSMVSETAIDLDGVNCVSVGSGLVLEQPRYLEPIPTSYPTDIDAGPTGLTPAELERW